MPKVSKVKAASSRPGDATPPKETLDKYVCTRCGRIFKRQRDNFPCSHSPLYRGSGGYLPVCAHCVDDLFLHYKEVLEDEKLAMQRVCMKFDIYWSPEIYTMVSKANTSNSRVRSYISKTNLLRYVDKTYDDTLDEEAERRFVPIQFSASEGDVGDEQQIKFSNIPAPDAKILEFWGPGLTPEMYYDLDRRYARWTSNVAQPIDAASESLYKQLCISEYSANKLAAEGKSTDAQVKTISTILGDLNAKPVQAKDDINNVAFDEAPFGVLIRIKENTAPIPKPLKEYEDVDGIVRYISVWFLGHLCKMLGIRNTYCKMYEDEMARLRVSRPELSEEDDEGAFNDIFGSSCQNDEDDAQ